MPSFPVQSDQAYPAVRLAGTTSDRPDVAHDWRAEQLGLDPSKLVFIDETWTRTNMTRPHGRSPRGQHLIDAVPYGRWKTSTFLAGLRQDGVVAPAVFDGAINGDIAAPRAPPAAIPQLTWREDRIAS